jgi:CRISPR type III-B/RAMP module RAMP protein Cmr6
MVDACRERISTWWDEKRAGSNAGLLRDRYLRVAVKDEEKNHPVARKNLFAAMCQSLAQSEAIYSAAYKRQETSFKGLKSRGLFKTTGRLIIGLGGENVLETGITLHHTYGTPIIPGTALKGLAAHYCNQTWGAADDRFKLGGEYHQTIFGTTEDSGHIIFHDAWVTPQSLNDSLQPDVMTPHHGGYYSDEEGMTPPTDFDDPNPVTFLSVIGNFCIAVSCDVPSSDGQEWADRVFKMLSDALSEWGIGGKTNAGYGRLEKIDSSAKPIQNTQSTSGSIGPDQPDAKITPAAPIGLGPRHEKGEIVDAKRTEDPKNRGRMWFKADDGFGGIVMFGKAPNIDIGKTARLEISGVMNEGYNFAVPGSREEHESQKRRDTRRRR